MYIYVYQHTTLLLIGLVGQSEVQNGNTPVIAIGCWRGRTNMSILIPTEEAEQLLDRLFSVDEKDLKDVEKENAEGKSVEDSEVIETVHDMQVNDKEDEDELVVLEDV